MIRNRMRIVSALVACCCTAAGAAHAQSASKAGDDAAEIAALKAEIEDLKRMLPSQSHTMADVEYHFSNLWFAGKAGNWPLATFYLNETRSHLNWTVRLHPVRQLADKSPLDLRPILQGVEDGGLKNLRTAIDNKDGAAFETAYKGMLNQCYACHQAAEKPYLKPTIPQRPESMLIDRNPQH